MTNTYVMISPVTRAYKYLGKHYPGKVHREEVPDDYKPSDTVVLVRSGGGAGVHSKMLLDARLTFEVRAVTDGVAEKLALEVEALLRDWENRENFVYLRGLHGIPTWDPEPEQRIPAYTWSMEFTFKSTQGLTK